MDFVLTRRTVEAFDSEAALAAALVGEDLRVSGEVRPTASGAVAVGVHVGPDGRVFATQFVC